MVQSGLCKWGPKRPKCLYWSFPKKKNILSFTGINWSTLFSAPWVIALQRIAKSKQTTKSSHRRQKTSVCLWKMMMLVATVRMMTEVWQDHLNSLLYFPARSALRTQRLCREEFDFNILDIFNGVFRLQSEIIPLLPFFSVWKSFWIPDEGSATQPSLTSDWLYSGFWSFHLIWTPVGLGVFCFFFFFSNSTNTVLVCKLFYYRPAVNQDSDITSPHRNVPSFFLSPTRFSEHPDS